MHWLLLPKREQHSQSLVTATQLQKQITTTALQRTRVQHIVHPLSFAINVLLEARILGVKKVSHFHLFAVIHSEQPIRTSRVDVVLPRPLELVPFSNSMEAMVDTHCKESKASIKE